MLNVCNSYLGTPDRLYRDPREIRREMNEIKDKISEVNETLSVHNLLMEVMSEWAQKEPEKWINELGYYYSVRATLTTEWYETRDYEDFSLPCGYYT